MRFLLQREALSSIGKCPTIAMHSNQPIFELLESRVLLSTVTDYVHADSLIDDGNGEIATATVALETVSSESLIAIGESWQYFKGVTAPPVDWAATGFDDSSWLSGPTGIGYSSDITYATDLPDMPGGYLTFYARTSFDMVDAGAFSALELGIQYDDGFVAYLNGVEVARSPSMGASGSTTSYDQQAPSKHDEEEPEEIYTISLDPGQLLSEGNVLAIEVHNGSTTSSDAGMIPRLLAITNLAPAASVNLSYSSLDAVPATVTFDGGASQDSDGTIADYSWDFGDGSPVQSGPEAVVQHEYLTTGIYQATLIVTDDDADTGAISIEIRIAQGDQGELISIGESWQYFKGVAAPPVAWVATAFDDSSWLSGPTGIGYSTDIAYGTNLPDMSGGYVTFYARNSFDVVDVGAFSALDLGIQYDDGFVAYFNGVEVARSLSMGIAGSATSYDQPSPGKHDEEAPEEIYTIHLDPGQLLSTDNVLAIEIHNNSISNSDAGMIPRLTGITNFSPTAGVDLNYSSPDAVPATVTFDGGASQDSDGTIVEYSWDFGDGSPVQSGPEAVAQHEYLTAGIYQAMLTVTDDDGDTDTISVAIRVGPGDTYYVADPRGADGLAGTADDVDANDTYPGTINQPFATLQKAAGTAVLGGVEMWRGGVGWHICWPTLSVAGASIAIPCSVSTSRSSNRTCGFPASGFRTRTHAFAHGKRCVSKDSSTNPSVL